MHSFTCNLSIQEQYLLGNVVYITLIGYYLPMKTLSGT